MRGLANAMNPTRSLAPSCRHVCAILMALAMCTHSMLLAETTGKLTGRVVDQRGQPVLGANVIVVGSAVGGAANDEGQYNIINVPAGVYDIRTSAVGYQAKIVRSVHINAGQTTTLDFAISESTIEADEVVTIAERPLVDTRQTSAVAILSRDDIEALPVQNLNDVVNLQAGVVDGHFRGGRAGEVQYQVDGVSVNNPYDNSSVIQLDRSVLQEVQVISGTFDAEYGQAMSGVVNAILRSGSEEQFEASAEIYGGAYVSDKDVFPHTTVSWPPALQSLTMSLSGPAGIPRTSFLLNIRRFVDDGYLWGQQTFLPTDASDFGGRRFTPAGSNAAEPMAWHKEWSGQIKIANRALNDVQLSYQAVGVLSKGKGFEFGYRFNPDGTRTQNNFSLVHGVDFTHTLSQNAFYTLSFRQNYFHYTDYVFSSLNDPGYALAGAPRGDPNYEMGAIIQGYDLGRFEQKTNALLFKGSLTSQVTRLHLVKLGFEVQTSSILFGAPGTLSSQILGPTQSLVYEVADTLAQNVRTYYPRSMALFIQDRIEVADFLVRAGLRAEYYDANATVPSDLENPANTIQGAPTSVQKPTTKKFALAPRLGVSYPITATGALYFSYGHFYQMPGLGNLYANSDYYLLRNLQSGNTSYGVMGNPDIKPEFTTQYEFGFKQQFGQSLGVDLSVFYKDIRDLLGVEFIDTYADSRYARFTNVDFGSVYGIRLAVDQRFTETFSVSLNYTYQNAMGNASDPHETANRAAAGEDPRPRQVPFDWDQRHTLNVAATVNDHDNLLATCIVRFGSGSPYTPSVGSGFGAQLEKNSSPKPTWVTVDMRAEKPFHIGTFTLSVFLRVFNLFDARYANGFVFSTTGSAFYSLTSAADRTTLIDPSRYTAPRRIEFGLGVRI